MKLTLKHGNTLVAALMVVVIMLGLMPAPQHAAAQGLCDWAQFVADVTVPDGTVYTAGATFNKTWRLRNVGACTWTTDYTLVFVDGTQMGAPASTKLPTNVAPGGVVDLTIGLTAPSTDGTYRGNFQLKNASGVMFGIGSFANKSFWVEIRVGTTSTTGYDFVSNAGSAVWTSGAGTLSFPGTEGDNAGFAKKLDAPKLENGTTDSAPGLLMVPQNVYNGFIQAQYPAFTVQSGDRFQSIVNCEFNATSCFVNFRLMYQIGSGQVLTYWTFNERYEGLFYRANIDLSPLAGQNVKFILFIGAAGYPAGDRALWGAPRITRGNVVPTPVPGTPPTPISSSCDRATFISDVNYPDGTIVAPNTAFTKTWRIKNTGSCTWTTNYSLVFASGDKMGGPDSVKLTSTVGPNTSFDVSVNLTSPATIGSYRGFWQFKNDKGQLFGIGYLANKPWWVDITVKTGATGPTNTPVATVGTATPTPPSSGGGTVAFDFTADPAAAVWSTGAGSLTFPGTDGDTKGFALKLTSVKLEDSSTDTRTSLLMSPQAVADGYIKAVYPNFAVQNGDHFKATIGCQFGANDCWVKYVLDYQVDASPTVTNLLTNTERYEGLIRNVDIDLSGLAGKNVKFIFTILADGPATGDRAVWVAPRITR
ncbi:MAG TPA: NBR1-Ig-like domain-containing protein [Anaerolineales bacterium]|jgi:hypothetical protein